MKQLSCEMCGSTDLLKQDGVFVCQTCGTKYSVEDARKMMIEGTVDVSGSVIKVDNTDRLENLYKLAREAHSNSDHENAEKYYSQIAKDAPDDWEAAFYSLYHRTLNCKVGQMKSMMRLISNSISTIIEKVTSIENKHEMVNAMRQIVSAIAHLSDVFIENSNRLAQVSSNHQQVAKDISQGYDDVIYLLINPVCVSMRTVISNKRLEGLFSDEKMGEETYNKMMVAMCHLRKKCDEYSKKGYEVLVQTFGYRETESIRRSYLLQIETNTSIIRGFIPDYVPPTLSEPTTTSGCYVATAVYGSYDCPQVWTLRRYRDNTLAKTWYGRAFIHVYYAISPTLVKWFGKTEWFKKMWQGKLDRMVAKLQAEGVESTPYEDKEW